MELLKGLMQYEVYPEKAKEHLVLEYVFYLSPEKLIFTGQGALHCHPQIFIT